MWVMNFMNREEATFMNKIFEYKSVLSKYMYDFLSLKTVAGFVTERTKWIFLEIDKFYIDNSIDIPEIKSEYLQLWRKGRDNDAPRTLYRKYSVWHQLAKFMSQKGIQCYVTPIPRYKDTCEFEPYIFSHEQIVELLKNASVMRLKASSLNSSFFCMPALVRFLYSTGVRISEALSLKLEDLNLEKQYAIIRKAKNKKERIVPISSSLKEVLEQYLYYRNRIPICNILQPTSLLFIKPDGDACLRRSINKWFRVMLRLSHISYVGDHKGPRVHDLRHTFAVHALEKMAKKGMDLYACLPILSACLGHSTLSATEHYVRLTKEIYPEITQCCTTINEYIYPKTKQ